MNKVLMIYSHRMAPGRAKQYLKFSQDAFSLVNKYVESKVIEELKILKTLTGNEEFKMLAQFKSVEDAFKYRKEFDQSGLSLKYQDVQLNTKFEFYEVLNDSDIDQVFQVLTEISGVS